MRKTPRRDGRPLKIPGNVGGEGKNEKKRNCGAGREKKTTYYEKREREEKEE